MMDDDLGLVEVEELGVRFASGEPVTFPYMHSTESAPYLGAKFGQDIEPAGFYLLSDTSRAAEHPTPGWEYGEITLQSPLVLAMTTTDDPMEPVYGPNGWKARLHRHYGLAGADLSRALLAAGYDSIVTVWVQGGNAAGTREIVDLKPVAMTGNPGDFELVGEPTASARDISDAFEFWSAHQAVRLATGHPVDVVRFRVVNDESYEYVTHLKPSFDGFGELADDREGAIAYLAEIFYDWDTDDAEYLLDTYRDDPIVVFVDGDTHTLADGFHRVESALVNGDRTLHATLLVVERVNPLDPYAFDTEAHPFIIHGQATSREQHLGVHTATEADAAATYAVQRAMIDGTLGIIFHLDVSGLDPLPDRDAIMKADTDPSWLFDAEDGLLDAVAAGDAELVEELLQDQADVAEYVSEGYRPTAWAEGAVAALTDRHESALLGVLLSLEPGELLAALQMLAARRALPAKVWMLVMGQQRYMVPFGLGRVVQIDAVRPIRDELWTWEEQQESGEDYPPDDPDQPELFCDMSFADEQWLPQTVTLWRNPDANPGAQVEYHGTDIARATSAFPELDLDNPWPYTQPLVSSAPSMWSVPQSFIEAAAVKPGVGIFPVAQTTGRLLMGERSWAVDSPGQWSGFGGSVEGAESLELAAVRELREETGYTGPIDLEEIAPRIFLGYVPDEYAPRLNWETEQARWLTPRQLAGLEPKHWGTDVLLDHLS
jgi:8-oxo-dGTP pyrophosphatase MutT (NUDIX family)